MLPQLSLTSALVLLPYLKTRAAPEFHKLIYPIRVRHNFYHGSHTLYVCTCSFRLQQISGKSAQNEPYLLCCGDICLPEQIYLVIEREIVCEIKNEDTIYALLSAFLCLI